MEKIKVNKDMCIGCGACTAICSDVFQFNDEGYAEVNTDNSDFNALDEDTKNDVMDALEGCPVGAISKEDSE